MRDLQDVVKVKKPTVVREGETVQECFLYKEMGECFEDRCFWKRNGECPIANALEESEGSKSKGAW